MGTVKAMTGERYGRLLVQSFCEMRKGQSYWNCTCECGNGVVVRRSHLIFGNIQSCGCLAKESARQLVRALGHKNRLDIVGEKYNRLTVISFNSMKNENSFWNVQCDCGNIKIVSGNSLRTGRTKSCGCMQRDNRRKNLRDLTGMRFGKLLVLALNLEREKDGATVWICLCDCGIEKLVRGKSLKKGLTKSCGCWKHSELESSLEDILLQNSIVFQKQYKLLPTRQRLDFLVQYKGTTVGIECQGEQHYEPINHFGGEKKFQYRKEQDEKKRIYLRDHNIRLIEIPYWEIKNMKAFLFRQLEELIKRP